MLAIAAAVLLLTVLLGGAGSWAYATGYNPYPMAPSWALELLARSSSTAVQDSALNELVSRHSAGKLSDERLNALALDGLVHQADSARPWAIGWGNAVEAAADRGLLSAEQIATYLERALEFHLEIRDEVPSGTQTTVGVRVSPVRCGDSVNVAILENIESLSIDDQPVDLDSGPWKAYFYLRSPTSSASSSLPVTLAAEEGEHELVATVSADLRRVSGSVPPSALADPDTTIVRQVRKRFRLLNGPVAGLGLVADPAMAPTIRQALSVRSLAVVSEDASGVVLEGEVSGRAVPVNCAFEVLLRVGGLEYAWGRLVLSEGQAMSLASSGRIDTPLTGDTVTVVFRASEEVLRRDTRFLSAWDGEIVLENVPVTGSGATD